MEIGTQYTNPQVGYQRIDNTDSNISYVEPTYWSNVSGSLYYKNTTIVTENKNAYIEFYVYTSKLAIIDILHGNRSDNIEITIDGKTETYSSYSSTTVSMACVYYKEEMEKKIHQVKIISNPISTSAITFSLDAIDIDDDGYLTTAEEYEKQKAEKESKKEKFPVLIGDDKVTSEEDIQAYAETVTDGRRQLLVADKLKGLYVTDGNGGYTKIIDENTTDHSNREVLDLLSTDGESLYFNGKNIQKIELEDGQYGYSGTFMNVVADNTYSINIDKGSKLCDQIVQVWEFESGQSDITTIAKTFNNHTSENFFYDNIEFTDDVCKVKDEFVLDNTLNETTGFYETKLNKSEFIQLIAFEKEVSK